MAVLSMLWVNLTLLLCFCRPLLVFVTFGSTLWVMFSGVLFGYLLGMGTLIAAMVSDWLQWLLARKYIPESKLVPVIDRMMDRLVISIVFPLLGAGMVWHYALLEKLGEATVLARLHMVFVLGLSALVLVRDQLVLFLRNMSQSAQEEGEFHTVGRWRMLAFYPMAVLIYAHGFLSPLWETNFGWWAWVGALPLRFWFFLEISFLILCVASITLHLRRYTAQALARITKDDEELRRKILAVIPNSLTLLNASLGIAAVIFASFGLLRESTLLLMGAGLFDRLDGMVARRLGLADNYGTRRLGVLFDDISDAISFCFAPAMIFYIVLSDLPIGQDWGIWLTVLAFFYGLAGVLRLVVFTLDKSPEPGFFKGMPTLGGAAMVMAPLVLFDDISNATSLGLDPDKWSLYCVVSLLVGAVMMNAYKVRYLHIGRLLSRRASLGRIAGLIVLVSIWTPYFGIVLIGLALFYLLSPLFTHTISSSKASLEQPLNRLIKTKGKYQG